MRKTLLLLTIGIWGAVQAQNNAAVQPKFITTSTVKLAEMKREAQLSAEKHVASQPSATNLKGPHKITSEPSTLPFLGSSANINGVLDAETTALTANQACSLIVMTHRDNFSDTATCGTGAYITAYSTNGGNAWDTTITTFCNTSSTAGARYPNGVLFNPAGNTTPSNVYDAMTGPFTTGSGWTKTVYGSVTIGGSNDHGMYWTNGTSGVVTQNTGELSYMSSSDDSTVHVIGEGYSNSSSRIDSTSWLGAVLTTGKFNAAADSFTWTQQIFRPHLVPSIKGFQNLTLPYDSAVAPSGAIGTAWSQDGKTGYVVIFGNLDSAGYNYASNQPIVYKTSNSGATWRMLPPYNFTNVSTLTNLLTPTIDSGVYTPQWFIFQTANSQGSGDNYDLTVDYMGNLHIFAAVVSAVYSNPDSACDVRYYTNEDGNIYDVYMTNDTGGWNARYITPMNTYPCANVAGPGGSENSDWDSDYTAGIANYVGFGNRLQVSRTTDGKHIFCTWLDDVSLNYPGYLAFPDIFGQGYDVAMGHAGPVKQFTHTENNYFACISDIALTSGSAGDTSYTIPCTIAFPQHTPSDGTTPINYFYLGTIVYNDSLGNSTSVPTVHAPGFSIGPNFPNPFNNTTQFNINLTKESVVSVDVFNMFGQKVYSMASQDMESGTHLMTINGSSWNSGVYFYRVTVDNQSVTQKMVVQQ